MTFIALRFVLFSLWKCVRFFKLRMINLACLIILQKFNGKQFKRIGYQFFTVIFTISLFEFLLLPCKYLPCNSLMLVPLNQFELSN